MLKDIAGDLTYVCDIEWKRELKLKKLWKLLLAYNDQTWKLPNENKESALERKYLLS